MLLDANGLYVRDDEASDEQVAAVKVSARVRDIVTRNLASPDHSTSHHTAAAADTPGADQLMEEIRVLQVRLTFAALCHDTADADATQLSS